MEVRHSSFLIFTILLVQGVLCSLKTEECLLDFKAGSGENWVLSYGFNKTSGQCEAFWYGGAEGNKNRFETLDECIKICDSEPDETTLLLTLEEYPSKVCPLKLDPGRYENWTINFGYNEEKKECEQFYYGGRGGNANRFKTEEECIDYCEPISVYSVIHEHKDGDCSLDIDNGEESNWKEYYAFSKHEKKCVPFFYGGKGGNGNRFHTGKECRWYCMPVSDTGKLQEDLTKMLYDSISFYIPIEKSICPRNNCMYTQNHGRAIVESALYEYYYGISNDVIIKLALAVDEIINDDNLLNKPYDLRIIVKNTTEAVMKVLKNVNKLGFFMDQQSESSSLMKMLFDGMNSFEESILVEDIKKRLMDIILKERKTLDYSESSKIVEGIEEVFTQYHELTWRYSVLDIANNVNYFVNRVVGVK